MHEMRDLGQRVAADAELQANVRLAQHDVVALVDEGVIDAPVGALHARLLEQLVRREVDAPVGVRASASAIARAAAASSAGPGAVSGT